MIRKLRIRFVLTSMLAVLLVLVIIMGAINFLNYRAVMKDADRVLALLQEGGGSFDAFSFRPEDDFEEGMTPPEFGENGVFGMDYVPEEPDTDGQDGGDAASADYSYTSSYSRIPGSEDGKTGQMRPGSGSFHGMKRRRIEGMSAETPFSSRYFTVVMNADGTVCSSDLSRIAAVDETAAESYALDVLQGGRSSGMKDSYRYAVSADDSGRTVIIFLDCRNSLENVSSFFTASLTVSLIAFAAVFVLVILVSGRVIRPISESYEKQRRFITDAGHELKTPLTIIDADVSVLEMDIGENEWLDDVKAQTKRLAGLTNDLIYLSRMDEGSAKLQMIDFPLSDMVQETAASFRSRAQMQEKNFTADIEPMIDYCGDEKSLTQLVTILLDNALKYSNEKGDISISLKKRSKGVELSVYNTVDSMDPETLQHMFDRFYRADKSRNSSTGGYGIGLSIANAVVQAHKGKISASSPDGRSLRITALL